MKGQIIDVYKEGGPTFRACVLREIFGTVEVVDLDNGKVSRHDYRECDSSLIKDIFKI